MKLKFNKWLFSLVALIFGFSGKVAAQYGVIENHYTVKGNIISEKCKEAIPKIKVTLRYTDAQGFDHDVYAFTDEKGNFSIDEPTLIDNQNYFLMASDVDGKDNKGEFEPARQLITLNSKDFDKAGYEDWNQFFECKTTYYFGLKLKKDQPCK